MRFGLDIGSPARASRDTTRYFAFAFGTSARFLLRDDAIERDSGVRAAMNATLLGSSDPLSAKCPSRTFASLLDAQGRTENQREPSERE